MPTLTTVRRRAARLLGDYRQGTATSGSTTGLLEATAAPFRSTLVENQFDGYWLFRPDASAAADKTRLIASSTMTSGQYTPDLSWTNAPYSGTGETFEFHQLLPPIDPSSSGEDLHTLINQALERCQVTVELTLTAAAATDTRHSVSGTYSWLLEPWRIRDVGLLPSGQTDRARYVPSRVSGYAYRDNNTLYVAGFSANTTDTIYLKVVAPAYYRCAAAATPTTFTQTGLSAEGDVCLPDVEWVAWQTAALAWEQLGQVLAPGSGDLAKEQQSRAAVMVSRLTAKHFEMPPLLFRKPVLRWGI